MEQPSPTNLRYSVSYDRDTIDFDALESRIDLSIYKKNDLMVIATGRSD